jgi:hypothetical protein
MIIPDLLPIGFCILLSRRSNHNLEEGCALPARWIAGLIASLSTPLTRRVCDESTRHIGHLCSQEQLDTIPNSQEMFVLVFLLDSHRFADFIALSIHARIAAEQFPRSPNSELGTAREMRL